MVPEIARTLFPAALSVVAAVGFQHANAMPSGAATAPTQAAAVRTAVQPARHVQSFADAQRQRQFDPFTQGARSSAIIAGLDRTGVSATPQRGVDPFTDGARDRASVATLAELDRTDISATPHRDVATFTDGARDRASPATLAELDPTGISAAPRRHVDPFTDGAMAATYPRKAVRGGASFPA